jgi:hypothetical protein
MLLFCTPGAAQTLVPFLGYAEVEARATSTGVDYQEGSGSLTAEAGNFCFFHVGAPGCEEGIVITPGTSFAWGQLVSDPASGDASQETHVANWERPAPAFGVPPAQLFSVTYLRSTWIVDPTDPSLSLGDPVDVNLSFDLAGTAELDPYTNATVKLAYMLNHRSDISWVSGDEVLSIGAWEDIQAVYGPEMLVSFSDTKFLNPAQSGEVGISGDRGATVTVGDEIVLETLFYSDLRATVDQTPTGAIRQGSLDFTRTLSTSLVATTPGAILTAVPEPSLPLLVMVTIAGSSFCRRPRRSHAQIHGRSLAR